MNAGLKKSTTVILFLVLFAIVGVIAFYGSQFSVDDSVSSGDYISVPQTGFIRCEESQSSIKTNQKTFSSTSISCKGAGDTLVDECVVNFQLPSESEIEKKESFLLYTICNEGEACNIQEGDTATEKVVARSIFINRNPSAVVNVPLSKGQFIYAEYIEGTLSFNPVNKGKFSLSYKPYQLVKYDSFSFQNGKPIANSKDCIYSGNAVEPNFIIEDVKGGGKLSSSLTQSEIANMNNMRSAGAVTTYITNFVATVPQYEFLDNADRYCYDKKIYAVEKIETPSGTYKVADRTTNKEIDSVDCCNQGDVPSGFQCVNFKSVPLDEEVGCSVLNPCPVSGYQSVAGKKVLSQQCVEGVCENTYTDVECSFNEDCGSGFCSIDPENPENNECVESDILDTCGNNVCEFSFGESVQSCPADCSDSPKQDNTLLWFIAIMLIGIFLLVLARAMYNRRKR